MKHDEILYRTGYSKESDGTRADAVVIALSEATGTEITEIAPLYESIDPDALESLFGSRFDGLERPWGRVCFSHHGCHITVDADQITVRSLRG